MKSKIYLLLLPLIAFLFTFAASAADPQPIMELDLGQLITQGISVILGFFKESSEVGSLPWYAKVAPALTLAVSALKSSKLQGLWNWMGDFKAYAGPLLGVFSVVVGMLVKGEAVTVATVIHALGAGVGAIAIHELFDTLKKIPGINKYVLMFIELVQGLLGGKTQPSSEPSPVPSQPAN